MLAGQPQSLPALVRHVDRVAVGLQGRGAARPPAAARPPPPAHGAQVDRTGACGPEALSGFLSPTSATPVGTRPTMSTLQTRTVESFGPLSRRRPGRRPGRHVRSGLRSNCRWRRWPSTRRPPSWPTGTCRATVCGSVLYARRAVQCRPNSPAHGPPPLDRGQAASQPVERAPTWPRGEPRGRAPRTWSTGRPRPSRLASQLAGCN